MTHTFEFYWENGWFIDLPNWPGNQSDLAMVLGADYLLDQIAKHRDRITLTFSDTELADSEILIKDIDLRLIADDLKETAQGMGGAFYIACNRNSEYLAGIGNNPDLSVWLCDVTKFVFGYMPDKIWYKENK